MRAAHLRLTKFVVLNLHWFADALLMVVAFLAHSVWLGMVAGFCIGLDTAQAIYRDAKKRGK